MYVMYGTNNTSMLARHQNLFKYFFFLKAKQAKKCMRMVCVVVKERIFAYLANLQTLRLHLETEIDALHEAIHETGFMLVQSFFTVVIDLNRKLIIY